MGALIPVLCRPPSASAFSPLSLPGLALWLDASDLGTLWQDSARTTAVAADADPVGAWDDKSGNARHVTQGTASKRPLYKTAIQNGRSVIRYDGVDDFLFTASEFNLTQPTTAYIVFYADPLETDGVMLDGYTSGRFSARVHPGVPRASLYCGDVVYTSIPSVAPGAFGASAWIGNGVSSVIRWNGVQVGSGDTSTSTLQTGAVVGCHADVVSAFFLGDIAEILVYAAGHGAGELARVEDYLRAKWGTP